MEAPPTSPAADPTADADADSESRAMTIISYPSRVWKSLAGSEQNVLSKLRIPSFSGLNLNFLLRSQRRRHGLPLPMYSTSAHSFRVVRDKTKPFDLLEEIVETTLSHIHATQKSLLFWQSRAEGTSSQKIYFMVFERGPRAFAKEMCRVIASLYTKKSSFKYLSDSASDMISTKLAILTSLQHSLSTFLAEVYLEVNQYKEVLNDSSEKSLSKSLVIIDGLFSKLETSLNHRGEINKDVNLGEIKFEKLQEADREREEWTEEEIKEATNLIYRNLQLLNSHLSSIFLRSEKPRRAAQYWVRYTAGAIGLSVCSFWIIKHSRLTGSSDIDNWIRDAKESITTFYKEHVEMPLLSIRDDLFETFKKRQKGVMEHEEVQLTADSLRRMLLAFCEQTKGQKLVGNLSDQDLMEIVMSRYEKEVMHPLQNLLSGELARAMLIQIQKLKLDLETAMLELDQILKANEINFAILAALPAFFFSVLLLGFLRKWILQDKGAEGRGRIARRQRRLLLVEIEKRLMQFQSYMDKGMDEEARCRFGLMLYSLDRLYKSVERHATETGEWISLRQDIVDLSKPDLGTEHKLVVVSRVERMYDCLLPSSSRL